MEYVAAAAIIAGAAWFICKLVAFCTKDNSFACVHTKEDCRSCPHSGNCHWEDEI